MSYSMYLATTVHAQMGSIIHCGTGVSGRVSVNGTPLAAVTMQRVCGYVLQDDVLPGTSTVQEYLR